MGARPGHGDDPEPLVLEGALLVERGIDAGLYIEELFCVPAREAWARRLLGSSELLSVLPEAELSDVAGYPFHRGVFARAQKPPAVQVSELAASLEGPQSDAGGSLHANRSTLLVLPELNDPENLGSAFRSAAALGCDAMLLGPRGPDPYSRRVLRVSMGASLSLPWTRLAGPEDLGTFVESGFVIAACVLDIGALDLRGYNRPERLALVLGNEAFGLSEPWLGKCDTRLTLPMRRGADSLNLATAAAIFLYALSPDSLDKSINKP